MLRNKFGMFMIFSLVLAGCANNGNIDYIESGSGEETSINSSHTDLGDGNLSGLTWEETFEVDNNIIEISVTTESEYDEFNVITAKEITEYSPEKKKEILDVLSNGEKVYYYDIKHMPKDVVKSKLEQYDALIADKGNLNEELKNYIYDKKAACKECLGKAPEELVLADDYSANAFLFYRNDVPYAVSFDAMDTGTEVPIMFGAHTIMGERNGFVMIMAFELYEGTDLPNNYVEEASTIEEIQEKTEQFLKAIGINEYSFIDSEKRSGEVYSFNFQQGEKCMPKEFLSVRAEYSFPKKTIRVSNDRNNISINTDGRGNILEIEVDTPIEIVEQTTDVNLLGFDYIKEIIKTEFNNNLSRYVDDLYTKYTYRKLKLGYVYVRDEKTKMVYMVPGWELRLFGANDSPYVKEKIDPLAMYINAIDGSILNPLNVEVSYKK